MSFRGSIKLPSAPTGPMPKAPHPRWNFGNTPWDRIPSQVRKFCKWTSLFSFPIGAASTAVNFTINIMMTLNTTRTPTFELVELISGATAGAIFCFLTIVSFLAFDLHILKIIARKIEYWFVTLWIIVDIILLAVLSSGGFRFLGCSATFGSLLWQHMDAINPKHTLRTKWKYFFIFLCSGFAIAMIVFNLVEVRVGTIITYEVNDAEFSFTLRGFLVEGSVILMALLAKRLMKLYWYGKYMTYYHIADEVRMMDFVDEEFNTYDSQVLARAESDSDRSLITVPSLGGFMGDLTRTTVKSIQRKNTSASTGTVDSNARPNTIQSFPSGSASQILTVSSSDSVTLVNSPSTDSAYAEVPEESV